MSPDQEKIILEDAELTEHELADKYGSDHSWGHHPVFTRAEWKQEVEEDNVICGYWAWVVSQIEQSDDEL